MHNVWYICALGGEVATRLAASANGNVLDFPYLG